MRINFLGASDGTPLSKTFEEIAPGTYKEASYPFVTNFHSIERDITSVNELGLTIIACAKEGLCLLKGQLDRPLVNESRAGHTDASTATSWVCLDVDYTVTQQTPEEFVDALGLEDVSFVFQRSASMGIKHHKGWRGHFFILLDSAQPPQALKQWLIQQNLVCTLLQPHIGLSASGGALTYPLDITTCQNDKLIYIAPPRCVNFEDPIANRFEYYERAKPAAHLALSAVSAAANQAKIKAKLAELRSESGLEKKNFKYAFHNNTEILTNPDPVTVTGKKQERGFVYLNLNGGDSWAYYFPVDRPEILYNFKGEPCMRMRDVDKEIYDEYSTTVGNAPGDSSGSVAFGFLCQGDDTYYRGFANPDNKRLDWLLPIGSKGKLRDFFVQHNVQLPKPWAVDEWQMEFDPTREGEADFAQRHINTYKQSDYIKNSKTTDSNHIPPTIDRVLTSVCSNEVTRNHFINWLAAVFQTRQKTNTAWIFQGVQGTGKGVLFTHIISPLIGRDYCHEMTMDRLDDDFNAYLKNNIILFIDEAKISDSRNGDRLLNRIKNLVTEPHQHIRGMHRNAMVCRNYSNIILASNYDDSITMEISDRRFNVAPRQEKPIQLEYEDIINIGTELSEFGNYLHSYQVDQKAVGQVLFSEARDKLIKLSETTVTSFFKALSTGDLQYFTQYLDNSIKADIEGIRYHDYALVVHRWIREANKDSNVSRNELRTCYQFLQNASISATKFTKMCAKYGFDIKPVRINDQVTRGIRGVRWILSKEELENHRQQQGTNVISLKERK